MTNVDDLVRIRIEEAARKIAAAKARREDLQEARRHGIAARHRLKLARLQQQATQPDDGPPEAA